MKEMGKFGTGNAKSERGAVYRSGTGGVQELGAWGRRGGGSGRDAAIGVEPEGSKRDRSVGLTLFSNRLGLDLMDPRNGYQKS